MWKKFLAIVLVLVVGSSVLFVGNPFSPAIKASASTYRSGFSIVPEKEDETGVASDSGFILSSQTDVTLDYVKSSVSMRDGEALTITPASDGRFLLKPAKPLEQNHVYFIDVKTAAGNVVSFAFQTRRDFTVMGSLPQNTAAYVPVDTGIELYFSYPDVKNIEKYFTISPKAEGRFESNGYTTVFVPKKLEAGTVYTVTVKKGLQAADGAVSLEDDYAFSFETSPDEKDTADPVPGALYISSDWLEFGSAEKPAVPFDIYINDNPSSAEVTMKVYQYKTIDDFVKAIREKQKAPIWAPYAMSKSMLKTAGLDKVLELKQKFDLSKWQDKYMLFPGTLKEGYYLVELSYGKLTAQAFLQIADAASYAIGDKDDTLFWLNDIKTGEPVKGAEIQYLADPNLNGADGGNSNPDADIYKTDGSGLVKLPAIGKKTGSDVSTLDLYKVRTADGRQSVINAGYSYSAKDYYNPYSEGLYWRYIQTDRTLYKPDDTVEFWGYIKSRVDGTSPDKVTVELAGGGYYFPMKANISRFLPFLSDPLNTLALKTEGGFYEGSMALPKLDPGSYTITVKDGDQVLSSTYFTVENYIKPQYKLEISSDKNAVFTGEKITFTIKASFFDGTPVANVPLDYSVNTYSKAENGKGVTDLNGVLKVEYTPKYSSDMQEDYQYGIHASADFPETGEISEYYSFRVFANDITFQSDGKSTDNKGTVTITANTVKLESLNDDDPENDDYTGEPVPDHKFDVKLSHIIWEKIENGDEYDAVNKVVRKRYEYREKRTAVGTQTVVTGRDGKASYEFPVSGEDGYYIAEITTKDNKGRGMDTETWIYKDGIVKRPRSNEYYTLKADKEKYRAGETVTVQVMKNGSEPLKDMRTLFVQARNGIQDYQVNGSPVLSQPFPEDFAPNYYLQGIVFTGKTYLNTSRSIIYDYEEKRLKLDIKTDKDSYRPGESMTITVKATDMGGKPVASRVNISLVDEALLKLSGQDLDPLAELYSRIDSGIIKSDVLYGGSAGAVRGTAQAAAGAENGMKVAFSEMDMASDMAVQAPEASASPKEKMDDNGAAVRSDFKDTALFKTLALDESGTGAWTFKLPDNITSFSLAAAAVSEDLHAGSDIQSARVSMPFFINDSLSLDYLEGDKPYVGLTAYGAELKANEKVTFEITVKELPEFKQSAQAKAFERVNLPLPSMKEGTWTLVMKARSESGKADALSRAITVYPSYRTVEAATLKNLTSGMKLDAGNSGLTTLIFTDAGRGSLINSLHGLCWEYGKRLDQKLVSNYAGTLLNEAIKDEDYAVEPAEFKPLEYRNEDGGYGILPYAGSDMKFTALITPLLKGLVDTNALKAYFYDTILSKSYAPAPALYALAELGEPVLLDLDRTAAIQNLTVEDDLFLGMAYEVLGDLTRASEIYQGRIVPDLEQKDPYIRVKIKEMKTGGDVDASYKLTALAAAFAARIGSPDASKLYAYVENNYSGTQYAGVEKVFYLAAQLKKLPDTKASFDYTLDGKTVRVALENGRSEVVKIPSVRINELKIGNVTGDVSVLSLYAKPYAGNVKNDSAITMTRKYYDAATGKETTAFKANDLVKVEISYNIDKTAIDSTYEISDYAPAGLKPLDNPWDYGIRDTLGCWYRQFDGQKVTFVVGRNMDGKAEKPLVYYARVASPGEYAAEGTVAQGSIVKSSMMTLKNTEIKIAP